MIKLSGILFASIILASASIADAGPDYTAANIVEHFTAGAEPDQEGKPPGTRSVFLGTTGFGEADTAKPGDERFNLLVTFEYNSDRLTSGAQRNLDEFAQAMNDPALQSARFAVEGHTDASGSDRYNLSLSEKRAAAVVSFLVGKGVLPSRLVARGFGEQKLLSDRPNDPINRRVETRLIE